MAGSLPIPAVYAEIPRLHPARLCPRGGSAFRGGYVPADRDVDEFARALRAVGEPIFGMTASRISMGRLLAYLFEVTERFGMQTRTELILLQRTMVVVEGVARTLDPEINIGRSRGRWFERYIADSVGHKGPGPRFGGHRPGCSRDFGPRLPKLDGRCLDPPFGAAACPATSPPVAYALAAAAGAALAARRVGSQRCFSLPSGRGLQPGLGRTARRSPKSAVIVRLALVLAAPIAEEPIRIGIGAWRVHSAPATPAPRNG